MIPHRRALLAVVAAAACLLATGTAPLPAKEGTVRTRAGQVYDGDVTDTQGADSITVTVHGITTEISRDEVKSITYGQGVDAEYQSRLARLDPKDVKGRMELARWAFAQRRYDLARDAATKALTVNPNSADATQFLTLVQSQQRMERNRERAATMPAGPPADAARPGTATSRVAPQVDWKLLSDAEMNRIRQEELRWTDTRVRVQFRNDVERRFLSANRQLTLNDWRAMTPLQRAIVILDTGDPALRDDVVLASEPLAVTEYRRLVQPIVQSNCSTAACHGGTSAGALVLNNTGDVNEAAAYTNLYILSNYHQKIRATGDQQSVFGGVVDRRMIDRVHPEDSLLLQYGLPRNQARIPHPDVAGLRPAFHRGRADTKYAALVQWVGTTLAPVTPNYGILYEPPVGTSAAATQAAVRAATTGPTRQR